MSFHWRQNGKHLFWDSDTTTLHISDNGCFDRALEPSARAVPCRWRRVGDRSVPMSEAFLLSDEDAAALFRARRGE